MERINNRYTRDMKQTAIEWLIEQLENHNGVTRSGFEKCIQQAKAMEKEQIENAYRKGYTESSWGRHSNSEQYYNETFKSE
jgi:hypothetical protein